MTITDETGVDYTESLLLPSLIPGKHIPVL